MIKVTRSPTPASLDGPASAGGIETKAAIAARKLGEDYDYKAYKSQDVVDALRAMFNKKCAYCEFNYAAGGPEDVEHFRPKGGVIVNDRLEKPGYYWLAATWSNLLPSCTDCNRKRTKTFPGDEVGVSGKANIFPVADEKHRWKSHSQRKVLETHMLLDPCSDDPEAHLEFVPDGLVVAVTDDKGGSSEKGRHSIDVYGLLRGDLVDQRRAKESKVRTDIENALELTMEADLLPAGGARDRLQRLAQKLLEGARVHLSPPEPYLAMTRAIFREYGLAP